MQKTILLSAFLCAGFLSAQSPTPPPGAMSVDPVSLATRQMEIFNRLVQDNRMDQTRQAADLRAQEFARREFWNKAQKFVNLWGDFATRLNQEQIFDAKLAKKVSKAFHDLENSEGWPIRVDK